MSEVHEHLNKTVVSPEGMRKMEEKLQYLTTVRRAEVAEQISIARGFGDLSENSEYDEAKNEQAKIEARIVEIEAMLKNVELIEDIKGNSVYKKMDKRPTTYLPQQTSI